MREATCLIQPYSPDSAAGRLCRLAQQLQGLGGDASDPEEMDAMVGVILKQLLSKQVLHQSMKVCKASFPSSARQVQADTAS